MAGALALPFTASAAMVEMDDSALAEVSGQAWVIEFPHTQIRLDDLTERDFSIGPINVSGLLAKIEGRFPVPLEKFRGFLLNSITASVSLSAGVLSTVVPVLGRLPDAHVRFETTTP
jgi:hypothetical protein